MRASAQTLREIAAHSPDPAEAQAAVWAMGNRLRLSDEDASVLLARLAATPDEQVDLLKTLLWALSLRSDRFPLETASQWATAHPSADVRRFAVRGLASAPGAPVETLHAVALNDPSVRNRSEAVMFVGLQLAPHEITSAAQEALHDEREPAVRARWLNVAGLQETPAAHSLLEEALRSPQEDIEVRTLAAEMLAARSAEEARALSEDASLPEAVRERVRSLYLQPGNEQRPG